MTIQPVETEQQFLGNEARAAQCPNCSGPIRETVGLRCQACGRDFGEEVAGVFDQRQNYVPNAHRPRAMVPALADPELAELIRKSITANRILGIARAESLKAEESFQGILAVEAEANEKAMAAAEALLAYTRKDAGL